MMIHPPPLVLTLASRICNDMQYQKVLPCCNDANVTKRPIETGKHHITVHSEPPDDNFPDKQVNELMYQAEQTMIGQKYQLMLTCMATKTIM